MTTITERNAKALVERNGSTLPETKAVAPSNKAPRKTVAKGKDAEVVAPSNQAPKATPTPVQCHCGCGVEAKLGRSYLPGHDARHAGTVARAYVENKDGAAEAMASLPPALRAKAERFVANRAKESARKAAAAAIRQEAKENLKAALAGL